jgi:hypothetical protein
MTAFDGFWPKVRRWCEGLEADNSREYFVAHRDVFEELGQSLATATWRAAAPVTGWLDREVGATTLEVQRGRGRR